MALDVLASQRLTALVGLVSVLLKVLLIEQILDNRTQLVLACVDAKLFEQISVHLAESHLVALLPERLADDRHNDVVVEVIAVSLVRQRPGRSDLVCVAILLEERLADGPLDDFPVDATGNDPHQACQMPVAAIRVLG